VPGAADARINPNGTGVEQLCGQCVGDERGRHVCDLQSGERYSGEEGALRCLVEGRGDVAFVSHETALKYTDGRSPLSWAANLKSSDFRLLCRIPPPASSSILFTAQDRAFDDILGTRQANAGRTLTQALITDYARCHIARIPEPIIATSSFTPAAVRTEALALLSQLSDTFLYHNRASFRLAGAFRNRSDLLFSDNAESIQSLRPDTSFDRALGDFLPILQNNDPIACDALRSFSHQSLTAVLISSLISWLTFALIQ